MSNVRAGHGRPAVSRGEPFVERYAGTGSNRAVGAEAFCARRHRRVDVLAMSIRVRIVLLAALACLLPELTGPARASTHDANAAGVSASAPLHPEVHLAAQGARASLPDSALDRLLTAPFAPAALADLGAACGHMAAPAFGHAEPGAAALIILPPSRGPPALS